MRVLGLPFYFQLFFERLPFSIPIKQWLTHTLVVGPTGWGKSQLISLIFFRFLIHAQNGKMGCLLIDPHGDIAGSVLRLPLFDPKKPNNLSSRLVIIDADDVEFPVALNLFDVGIEKLNRLELRYKESALNAVLDMYEMIFSDLVQQKLTPYQQNIFRFSSELLFHIPGANLQTLIELLQNGEHFRAHFGLLAPQARSFMERDFFDPIYQPQKAQITARVRNLLSNKVLGRMLNAEKNNIDFYKLMNDGAIVVIKTSKSLLQSEASKILAKFFMAKVIQAAYLRARVPENFRTPFIVFVDEAHNALSDKISEAVSELRKFGLGFVFAIQYLYQLTNVSRNLLQSILNNTGIKIIGRTDAADARALSLSMGCEDKDILSLKTHPKAFSEFMVGLRDQHNTLAKVTIPLGLLGPNFKKKKKYGYDSLVEISPETFSNLQGLNRTRFSSPLKKMTDNPPESQLPLTPPSL